MGLNGVFLVVVMAVVVSGFIGFTMGATSAVNTYKRNCEEFGAISFLTRTGQVTVYQCLVKN